MKTTWMLRTVIVAILLIFPPPDLGHQAQAQRPLETPPRLHKVTAKQIKLRPGFSVIRRTQGTFAVARSRKAGIIIFEGSCGCDGVGQCSVVVQGNVILCIPGSPPCAGLCELTVEFPEFLLRSRGYIY